MKSAMYILCGLLIAYGLMVNVNAETVMQQIVSQMWFIMATILFGCAALVPSEKKEDAVELDSLREAARKARSGDE